MGGLGHELHVAEYLARGRRHRRGEPFLCAGAFSSRDRKRLVGPRVQGDLDPEKTDRRGFRFRAAGASIVRRSRVRLAVTADCDLIRR